MIAQLSEELVWGQIVARAWCDEGFMKRLLSDPRSVLAEHDLEVPPGAEVEVVLGTDVKVDDTDSRSRRSGRRRRRRSRPPRPRPPVPPPSARREGWRVE